MPAKRHVQSHVPLSRLQCKPIVGQTGLTPAVCAVSTSIRLRSTVRYGGVTSDCVVYCARFSPDESRGPYPGRSSLLWSSEELLVYDTDERNVTYRASVDLTKINQDFNTKAVSCREGFILNQSAVGRDF